jgi:hypothetical protein
MGMEIVFGVERRRCWLPGVNAPDSLDDRCRRRADLRSAPVNIIRGLIRQWRDAQRRDA